MSTKTFTLIEVLEVVANIALLITFLIPVLGKARDQSRRAVCSSNMHQQLVAMSAYSADFKGFLPWRGWFSSTVPEAYSEAYDWGSGVKKVPINLSMLMGKHAGKNWDILYCPSTIRRYKDTRSGYPTSKYMLDQNSGVERFTHGNYNYAAVMKGRFGGSPRMDQYVYPRDKEKLDGYWLKALDSIARKLSIEQAGGGDVDLKKMMPIGPQVLVMDFIKGGGVTWHQGGVNTAYSDGHSKFQFPKDGRIEPWGVGNDRAQELWYEFTMRP